ncbi:MAG TPA: PadR family transcriptional regulator [Gemmatimonadaceae bacterium]|nr:PadR family transcriptional regulator [Gemmatimonadaceae bacterium]
MPGALPFLKGTMDILVLKALGWTPMHGFELARWLEERSGAAFEIDEAAVYQSLYRLEAKALVAAEWGRSEKGHRARYYRLTAAGREHLRREAALWRQYAEVVASILDAAPKKA